MPHASHTCEWVETRTRRMAWRGLGGRHYGESRDCFFVHVERVVACGKSVLCSDVFMPSSFDINETPRA